MRSGLPNMSCGHERVRRGRGIPRTQAQSAARDGGRRGYECRSNAYEGECFHYIDGSSLRHWVGHFALTFSFPRVRRCTTLGPTRPGNSGLFLDRGSRSRASCVGRFGSTAPSSMRVRWSDWDVFRLVTFPNTPPVATTSDHSLQVSGRSKVAGSVSYSYQFEGSPAAQYGSKTETPSNPHRQCRCADHGVGGRVERPLFRLVAQSDTLIAPQALLRAGFPPSGGVRCVGSAPPAMRGRAELKSLLFRPGPIVVCGRPTLTRQPSA